SFTWRVEAVEGVQHHGRAAARERHLLDQKDAPAGAGGRDRRCRPRGTRAHDDDSEGPKRGLVEPAHAPPSSHRTPDGSSTTLRRADSMAAKQSESPSREVRASFNGARSSSRATRSSAIEPRMPLDHHVPSTSTSTSSAPLRFHRTVLPPRAPPTCTRDPSVP